MKRAKLSLREKVVGFLKQNPEQKFIPKEIAKQIFKIYPDEYREKLEKSEKIDNEDDLVKQIASEISRERPKLQNDINTTKVDGKHWEFYFTKSTDSTEIDNAESSLVSTRSLEKKDKEEKLKEKKLYSKLYKFLRSKNVYSKRINEGRSKNRGGSGSNKWLHPDLVGMENLSEDWGPEIRECVKETHGKKTKLWSFEVKPKITRGNVRKAFSQAVSNSLWANLGYLVAGSINEKDKELLMKEIRMLADRHGIGLILLNPKTPENSEIMISAKERSEIDWNMANRLAENKDFLGYTKNIRQFYQTGEISEDDWKYRD